MPKRPSDEELGKITKKLKKIEKQLKKRGSSRRAKNRILSSSSEEASHSPDKQNTGKPHDQHEMDMDSILFESEEQTQLPEPSVLPINDQEAITIEETPQVIDSLDEEMLEILGDDPTATTEYGANIRQELANRLNHIATCGLNKEQRSEMFQKYLIPGNCMYIGAPKLNPEIRAAITETVSRRDKFIEGRQKKIAATISCLAVIISGQLDQKDRDNKLLKNLMDASRLLCDIQHDESNTRRNFVISTLKKETKDSLYSTKIDNYLFGESLTESLKAAKAVTKSGTDLKSVAFNKNHTQRQSLNWRAPVPARRPPMTTRSHAPAAAATRPYQAYRAQPPPPPHRAPRNASWRAPPPPPPRSTRKR